MTTDIHTQMQNLLVDMQGDWVLTRDGSGWHLEGSEGTKAVDSEVAQLALDRGLIEVFRSRPGIAQHCLTPVSRKVLGAE